MELPASRVLSPAPTSPTSPLAAFPPQPEPSARSRAPEYYGFVAWTSTALAYFLYLGWAILPPHILDVIGITWYPNREWAILVPAYTIVLVLATYASYFALTLMGTPNFDSLSTIIDRYAHFPVPEKQENPYLAHRRSDAVPVPYDIPLGMVNRILYRRDSTDENLINQQS